MSVSIVDLERQLKAVAKTGKYIVGRKEVVASLKGSKLVVWSGSANVPPKILNECQNLRVPALRFEGSPIELGKICGIPYKVSVIAIKSPGDAVLSSFENSRDYGDRKLMPHVQQPIAKPSREKEAKRSAIENESKPSTKRKVTKEKKLTKTGESKESKSREGKKKEKSSKINDKVSSDSETED